MRQHSLSFRLTATTALVGMLLGNVAPAMAQGGGQAPLPPLPSAQLAAPAPGEASLPAAGDPPARVGRVARIGGTVSFHNSDATQWEPATLNEPVTSGNGFWTQPGASTDIEVGGTRVVLDQTSEFSVDQLDDTNFNATAAQGRIYLRVRDIQPGENTAIRTPRGVVVISAPGRYEIVVGDTETPTLISVDEGAATVEGPGVNLSVGDHQTAQISGADPFNGLVVAEQSDNFLQGQIERDHPPRAYGSNPPPPALEQMTGYDAVADTGTWTTAPDYGQVWYPPVAEGWVPYREGHWAFIAPWGWTWVDDAPWGFAPFHYGRWVEIGPRWGWIPFENREAYRERPVYAPALVAFVGVGAGVAVGLGIAAGMGWIPLGPREAYHPPYAASNNYFRRVNESHVANVSDRRETHNYVNARAATVAPGSALQNSQNLRGVARGIQPTQLGALQPVGRPTINPTLRTQGVTPGVARSLNLPTTPSGTPGAPTGVARPTAPGPSFQGRPQGATFNRAPTQRPSGVAAPSAGQPVPVIHTPTAQPTQPHVGNPVGAPAPQVIHTPSPQPPHPEPQFQRPLQPQPQQHQFQAPPQAPRPEPQPQPQPQQHQFQAPPQAPRPEPQHQFQPPPQAPRPEPQRQFQPPPQPRPEPRPAPPRVEPPRPAPPPQPHNEPPHPAPHGCAPNQPHC